MQGNVIKMPTGSGGGMSRGYDPLRRITPPEAARRTGIPYGLLLEVFKVHGTKIGHGYYMCEQRLLEVLNENRQIKGGRGDGE